ncbi:MAG TPA: DUF4388 domain-containing protein [Candidatus Obscuribacterales bacterium]
MYQRPSTAPKAIQRLPARPVLGDLQHFLAQAMQFRGTKINIAWPGSERGQEYMLAILCNRIGGDPEWRMYMGSGNDAKLLWFYVSNDVLLVYNLVVSSCGGDTAQPSQAAAAPEPRSVPAPAAPPRDQGQYALPGITRFAPDATSPHVPVVPTVLHTKKATLSGDLSLVQVTNLLPSMQMASMTGRLLFESEARRAELYLEEGTPVHAVVGSVSGSEAVLELITWKDGLFRFEPRVRSEVKTIDQTLDALMLKGVQLIDNVNYLKNAGIKLDSTLVRKHRSISEQDFERMLAAGAPIDMEPQRRFYINVDGRRTLMELAAQLQMPRSHWIPIVCNLVRCDLIAVSKGPEVESARQLVLEPKRIDRGAIESVMVSLRRPQTGMFTYPAFLYFLEQEYLRRYRTESPVSVIVFEMRAKRPGLVPTREPLPTHAVAEAARRISLVKRPIDMLCHYEMQDYALLLPNTRAGGAHIFANRLIRGLTSEPFPGLEGSELSLAMGISCMPDDFLDMPLLLAGAEVAREYALRKNIAVALFRDMNFS